jgi:hypothetical protein
VLLSIKVFAKLGIINVTDFEARQSLFWEFSAMLGAKLERYILYVDHSIKKLVQHMFSASVQSISGPGWRTKLGKKRHSRCYVALIRLTSTAPWTWWEAACIRIDARFTVKHAPRGPSDLVGGACEASIDSRR